MKKDDYSINHCIFFFFLKGSRGLSVPAGKKLASSEPEVRTFFQMNGGFSLSDHYY